MPKKSLKKATGKAVMKKAAKKTAVKKAVKKATKKAGRPKGTGKYGCATKSIRLPAHLKDAIQAFIVRRLKAEGKNQ